MKTLITRCVCCLIGLLLHASLGVSTSYGQGSEVFGTGSSFMDFFYEPDGEASVMCLRNPKPQNDSQGTVQFDPVIRPYIIGPSYPWFQPPQRITPLPHPGRKVGP